jgi:hypothetical protein
MSSNDLAAKSGIDLASVERITIDPNGRRVHERQLPARQGVRLC